MSNMSYCRFRNTLADLRDCHEYMEDTPEIADEQKARERLIKLCVEIALDYGHEVGHRVVEDEE